MGKALKPEIKGNDLQLMEALLCEGHIRHKYAVRLQTVINKTKNQSTNNVALILGINVNTVSDHIRRYNEGGIEALLCDKTRKPGIEPVPDKIKNKIIQFACQKKPEHQTHWSTRELGKHFGISHTAVNTILKEHGIKPHIVKKFQFSTDKDFESKLADVVGLYLDPPENSIVLCVDEKSQIQALERTQPILPMRKGIPERQTHDYYRHGTTTLFAALNAASGKVIGKCSKSHKAEDYVEFLKLLDRKTPRKKVLHIIADNYSSHKAPAVKQYLEHKKGRFVEHFIPTYSSWLNMVERWFAEITNKRIRRESWSSLKELEKAITDYIISWNESKRRFCWTKTFNDIQKSIEKAKTALC
jgi:transposase